MARLAAVVPWVALAVGLGGAYLRRWLADDAYISFRYARNLVEGHGLVYNLGERVEGYTNFAWTLWTALGLALGASAPGWSVAWGLAAYGGLILWLSRRAGAGPVPLAALVVAADPLLWTFATSGLESSWLCLLAPLSLVWGLEARGHGSRRLVGAGLLLGGAYLVRPDMALLGAPVLAWLVWPGGESPSGVRLREAGLYAAGLVLVVAAHLAFRAAYYGELLPNTFHAKSAHLAWYGQGLAYVGYYLQLAWPLLLAPGLLLVAAVRRRPIGPGAWASAAAAALYAFYVVRVGGDFMLGRLLAPVSVLLALCLERSAAALWPRRAGPWLGLAAVVVAGLWLTPAPDPQAMWRDGIVDERSFPDPLRNGPPRAPTLRRYFDGLDVRVAFTGGDARLMYEARVPVAIEAEAGLTDRRIARRELERRGRVGHEKHAPLAYLVDERGVHFTLRPHGVKILGVASQLPLVEARLDGVRIFCLRWDPALMAALAERGAAFTPFTARLDALIARLPTLSDASVRAMWPGLRRFYFDHVDDPGRRAAFEKRLR